LQSGFDGDELQARPSIELVTVDSAIAKKAEQRIETCEYCHPADAEIPFDWLLAEVTGKRGPYECMLSEPVRCPNCKHEITEKTLVEPKESSLPSGLIYSPARIFTVLAVRERAHNALLAPDFVTSALWISNEVFISLADVTINRLWLVRLIRSRCYE